MYLDKKHIKMYPNNLLNSFCLFHDTEHDAIVYNVLWKNKTIFGTLQEYIFNIYIYKTKNERTKKKYKIY